MTSKIIWLIIIVILLIIVTTSNKTKEQFDSPKSDNIFSRVDPTNPTCLAKCILENGATIDFCKPLFNWNEKNSHHGFCHTANDKTFPFVCDSKQCKDNCGDLSNAEIEDLAEQEPEKKPVHKGLKHTLLHIDPTKDYSRCVNTKYGCVEQKLNHLSQGCTLYTAGCRECIKNYYNNIETLWKNSVVPAIDLHDECPNTTN
tara:strand:+ start:624 stop:1226 length:603 start_codon:yes stop_codon:yes gene_type:complete